MPEPNDALASAKKFLADAQKRFPPTPAATTPSSANPTPAKKTAAPSGLAAELGEKKANTDQFKKENKGTLMPSMHKGGVVEKDGPHNLQKGEVVIAKDTVKKAMKNAGMKDGMMEASEKDDKKKKPEKKAAEKKSEDKAKKAVKRPRHMHISRAKGGFVIKHEYDQSKEPGAETEQPEEPTVVSNMQGLHDHIDQNMSEPEPGEMAEQEPQK